MMEGAATSQRTATVPEKAPGAARLSFKDAKTKWTVNLANEQMVGLATRRAANIYRNRSTEKSFQVSTNPFQSTRWNSALSSKVNCPQQPTLGPDMIQIWSRNTPESGVNETLVLCRLVGQGSEM